MANQVTKIYKYLYSIDIKGSNFGMQYLVDAICLMIEDPIKNQKINSVYEKIAQKYETSSLCVEREIRYNIIQKKLSNREFIVRVRYDFVYCSQVTKKRNLKALKVIKLWGCMKKGHSFIEFYALK